MTRPKVEPDKRQRTAQACDSCKRRKQKCDGLEPCKSCTKRNFTCSYGGSENGGDEPHSPSKRRLIDPSLNGSSPVGNDLNSLPLIAGQKPTPPQMPSGTGASPPSQGRPSTKLLSVRNLQSTEGSMQPKEREDAKSPFRALGENGSALDSRRSTTDSTEEEAVVYNSSRMLQDHKGRFLYVGDAATLSFLQLVRMIVDNVMGPTPFTVDPNRYSIVENSISLPPNIRQTHLLPDRMTADVLVEAYFTNTHGLVEIFHRKSFLTTLDACYTDPLHVDPSWLCLLYLTFAIGLVMASPVPGTREHQVIQKLRDEAIDRAEVFYSDAKNLGDPTAGFEDAGFWSVQALTLMSVYMLAVSKRNAAYAYYGMAVRSAFALGLHREETMCIFSSMEQSVRRNLWRSLFVLDRFLSASLGRPTAIRESDCSGSSLKTGETPPFPQAPFPTAANADFVNSVGLEASVRSSHVIGVILDKVYSQRKISTRLAQEIADHCKGLPKSLDPSLHWRQANSTNPKQGIAILHVNLLYCHSIVLLTRPFFLFLMNKAYHEGFEGQRPQKFGTRMEKFAEACVLASSHSIALVQNALEGQYLPHRNPFVLYFLFASALVVLSNEFAALYHNPTATSSINNAISIMGYCAQHDPQAKRLLFILNSFRDVLIRRQTLSTNRPVIGPSSLAFLHSPSMSLAHENGDPLGNLLQTSNRTLEKQAPSIPSHMTSGTPVPIANSPLPYPSGSPEINFNGHGNLGSHGHHQLSRDDSLDAYLDLARMPSGNNSGGSTDGNDSHGVGDTEIDFESLWQWSTPTHSVLTPGATGIGLTPSASMIIPGGSNQSSPHDGQGVNDIGVPLYGAISANFGGA